MISYAIDYSKVLRALPLGSTDDLGSLGSVVVARQEAEQPARLTVIRRMPEPGINYLPAEQGRPIVDPHWRFSTSPLLRQRFELLNRSITIQKLPALQFRPGLQVPR